MQASRNLTIYLDVYGRPELAPRQIPNRSFIAVVGVRKFAATARAFQLAVTALAPNPQLQHLVLLVDSLPVHAVTGPLKDSGELVVAWQPLSLTAKRQFRRMAVNPPSARIPAQSRLFLGPRC